VQLGGWGQDFESVERLPTLVRRVLRETSVERLRLSSVEPWSLDDDFFGLWDDPRLCPQLHLPLQSGSEAVLRRMGRSTSPDAYAAIVALARQVCPGIALTTDMIVGFPGETGQEFAESLAFAKSVGFSRGHVFVYSAREGTAASRLPVRVNGRVARERSGLMRSMFQESGTAYARGFLGMERLVLWETARELPDGWFRNSGLTDNYLRVETVCRENLWNRITPTVLALLERDVFTAASM